MLEKLVKGYPFDFAHPEMEFKHPDVEVKNVRLLASLVARNPIACGVTE
jgi:hypothetical protein